VDLGQNFLIRKIVLQGSVNFGRHYGHKIRAGTNSDILTNPIVGTITDFPGNYAIYTFELKPPTFAQYVGISSDNNQVGVCEFFVYT